MPLKAYINKEEIISIDQTDDQWNELKKRLKGNESLLTLPCCGKVGLLRISRNGIKHFVHSKPDETCEWEPDSAEHIKAKIEIISACRENGWKAIPEFSEGNWRTDVLAEKNDLRIAFEVQWRKQTLQETQLHQNQLRESNIRGCWFIRIPPKELKCCGEGLRAIKETPAFKVLKDEHSNIVAELRGKQIPLKSMVNNLLKRKIQFRKNISLKSKQEVTIVFFEMDCWKCHKPQHCFTVEQNLLTICNQDFYLMEAMWENDVIDKKENVYEAIKRFITTDRGKHLKIGQLKKRYSKTIESSYLSHGCFYCDSLFGDFQLYMDKHYALSDSKSIRYKVELDLGIVQEEYPHWCYSEDGQFCN